MRVVEVAQQLASLGKKFYTIDTEIQSVKEGLKETRADVSSLRHDLAELTTRVAVLEEARKGIDERVRAEITKAVAELQVNFAHVVADLRIAQAHDKVRQALDVLHDSPQDMPPR